MKHLVTKADIVKLEEIAAKKYNHTPRLAVEIAGFNSAKKIKKLYLLKKYCKIILLSGGGNNAAVGHATAKYLLNFDYEISVFYVTKKQNSLVKKYKSTLKSLMVENKKILDIAGDGYQLIIDALVGHGQVGELKSPCSEYIASINELEVPVVSIDNPTGLNIDTGNAKDIAIKSTHTLVLAAEKQGLYTKPAQDHVGDLELVNLGIPKAAYFDANIRYPF